MKKEIHLYCTLKLVKSLYQSIHLQEWGADFK